MLKYTFSFFFISRKNIFIYIQKIHHSNHKNTVFLIYMRIFMLLCLCVRMSERASESE